MLNLQLLFFLFRKQSYDNILLVLLFLDVNQAKSLCKRLHKLAMIEAIISLFVVNAKRQFSYKENCLLCFLVSERNLFYCFVRTTLLAPS